MEGRVVVDLAGTLDGRSAGYLRHVLSDLIDGQGNLNLEIDSLAWRSSTRTAWRSFLPPASGAVAIGGASR